MSLKQIAFKGVKWTALSSVFAVGIQLLQVVVLSRYLDKRDFGLMAMALFVINFSQIFMDLGISNVIIQKRDINSLQLSTFYWLNILIGGIIYGFIALLAPFISWFYKEPELIPILHLVGVTFLIMPLGQQFDVLMQKIFHFKPISIITICSKTGGFVLSIIMAVRGFGVFSIVYGNIFNAVLNSTLMMLVGLKYYKPKLAFSFGAIRGKGFFSFGGFQMGAKIVYSLTMQIDTLFIGKVLGMDALGMYNIAKMIATRPAMVISMVSSKVSFPVFAQLQNDIEKLKDAFLKFLHLLAASNAPIYTIIIVFAKPLIEILFSTQWIEVVPCVRWLALASCLNSIWNAVAILLLAQGKAKVDFFGNLILVIFIPISVLLGQRYGLTGIAMVLSLARLFFLILSWRIFIRKGLPNCRFNIYLSSFIKPSLIGLAAGLTAMLMLRLVGLLNNYLLLILGGLLICVLYLVFSGKYDKVILKELKLFIKGS